MIINQIILVPHVIGLLRFKSKYGSFGKDQYLFEQTTYLTEKEILKTPFLKKHSFLKILKNLIPFPLL